MRYTQSAPGVLKDFKRAYMAIQQFAKNSLGDRWQSNTKQIDGEIYTAGDSSGSYAFDLRNPIFECIYTNARKKT